MKKFLIKIIALFLIVGLNVNSFAFDPHRKIKVSVTSSHLYSLLKEICSDKLELTLIVPPIVSADNYELDRAVLTRMLRSNIILYHYWQDWAKRIKYEMGNLSIVYKELKTEGNLMIPYINIRAAEEIAEMFGYLDPDNKQFYERNLVKYVYRVNHVASQISVRASLKYHNKKIVCNNKLTDFMQWLGCDIIAEYGKPENVSPAQITKIAKKIEKNNVQVVIDNLQTGTDIGEKLAKDLNIEQIVISNYPLNYSYIDTLKDNVLKIDKVLQKENILQIDKFLQKA